MPKSRIWHLGREIWTKLTFFLRQIRTGSFHLAPRNNAPEPNNTLVSRPHGESQLVDNYAQEPRRTWRNLTPMTMDNTQPSESGEKLGGLPFPVIPLASISRDQPHGFPSDSGLEGAHHGPVIMVAEGGHAPHAAHPSDSREKFSAALTTILVHAVIALLFCAIVISIPQPNPIEILATTDSPTVDPPPIRPYVPRATTSKPAPPSNQSVAVIISDLTAPISAPTVEFTESMETVDLGTSSGIFSGTEGAGPGWGSNGGIAPVFKNRCTEAERATMRQKHGGKAIGDKRIKDALKYLQKEQNEDGSWGKDYRGAMTGLALLSYLGHCETPDSTEYGETVMKGIMYLVEFYKDDSRHYATSSNHGQSYEHGIATYALGETYAIARLGKRRLPGMKEAFEQGVQTIIDGQNPDGGWSYGYPARGTSDTSVTGWQYQALKAAKHTSLRFDGLDESIKKAQQHLGNIQDRNSGMFPYRPGQPGKSTLTGAGVLGLQMLGGQGYEDAINKGLEAIVGDIKGVSWKNANLYEWYYNTQACFEGGGSSWKKWNDLFQDEIIKNQEPNGSWSNGGAKGHTPNEGDIYATCLCTLMLEVYYRYLPAASAK